METGCSEGELSFPGIIGWCERVDEVVKRLHGKKVGEVGDEDASKSVLDQWREGEVGKENWKRRKT